MEGLEIGLDEDDGDDAYNRRAPSFGLGSPSTTASQPNDLHRCCASREFYAVEQLLEDNPELARTLAMHPEAGGMDTTGTSALHWAACADAPLRTLVKLGVA